MERAANAIHSNTTWLRVGVLVACAFAEAVLADEDVARSAIVEVMTRVVVPVALLVVVGPSEKKRAACDGVGPPGDVKIVFARRLVAIFN